MKYLSAAALAAMVFFLAGAAAQERGPPPRLVLAPGGVRIVAPDLVIRHASLHVAGQEVQQIHGGQPFWVCYQVKNIGAAHSGPFRVDSDGTAGVPEPSHHNHGPLAAGASRSGCLLYTTTLKTGTYWAGVRADSPVSVVGETNETNNNRRIVVTIVP